MNRAVLVLGALLVVPLVAVLLVNLGRDPRAIQTPMIGRPAPPFALPEVGSTRTISLADFRGKPVVVNFWATWCVPCYAEHEVLRSTAAAMGDNVHFLGIVYDDTEQNIQKFLAQNGAAYPALMDAGGKTAIAYGVYGVPETFFIDANGKIVEKFEGALDYGSIQANIRRATESGTVAEAR